MSRTSAYAPFPIGRRFLVVPPDAPSSPGGRIDLVMERGAFGSGEHETTASCIELIETLADVQDARLLDLGSGTGILALAALHLGASAAVCVDINHAAVATARRNVRFNGFEDRVEHLTGELEDVNTGPFDLVLANIYGDLLLQLAPTLARQARPGAPLLLSGILWEHNFDVRQAFEHQGCRVASNRLLEEFSTVLLRKES